MGQCSEIFTGFAFKSEDFSSVPAGKRLLRGENITLGSLRWEMLTRYWNKPCGGFSNYEMREGDIVLGMDGSRVGRNIAMVSQADLPSLLVQRVARFRVHPCASQRFLFYLLRNKRFQQYIDAVKTGTSIPHISIGQLRDYRFALPPLHEQHAIAEVLGSLDDKIELNRQTNKTLEEMASAIFKAWFVDFEPVKAKAAGAKSFPSMPQEVFDSLPSELVEDSRAPGGVIPKGWRVGPLSDLIRLEGGGTPATSNPDFWGGPIPWFSVKDAPGEGEVWVVATEKHITQRGIDNSSSQLLPIGTTIISARGTVGKLAMVGVPMAMNQSCYGAIGVNGLGAGFTYFNLKEAVNRLQQQSHGSVFDTITRTTFSTCSSICPSSRVADGYEAVVEPLLDLLRANLLESQTLAELRDTLLPKLLSGEVRVSQAEKLVS